jgi:serine/threonine-protein kinase
MTMGTLEFLAPEQAMGKRDIDHRVDVYSAGAILFHAVSGNVPYQADSIGELITKMLQEGPRPVARVAPDLPPAVTALIDRCLAVDPDRRPRTARELLTEVAAIRARLLSGPEPARTVPMAAHSLSATPAPPTRIHHAAPPPPAPAPPPAGREDSRSFTIAVFAVVILVALIGLGALALRTLIDAFRGPDGEMELLEDPEGEAPEPP